MLDIIVTCAFGLEALVKRDLIQLGIDNLKVQDGQIQFQGTIEDVAKCNIHLATADRVYILLKEFPADTFEALFQGVYEINWPDILSKDGKFIVQGTSYQSKLFSIRDCQKITEKAIIEKMKTKYAVDWFEKSAEYYRLEVQVIRDICRITLDTSGVGLHKRGYREKTGKAPIRENLAAAMLDLSYWNENRPLYDAFCGSGTIAIEACRKARNIASGLDRDFDFIHWNPDYQAIYKNVRKLAMERIDYSIRLNVLASDIDGKMIEKAIHNAEMAGVREDINFITRDFRSVVLSDNYGVLITNPPYGKRLGERRNSEMMYQDLGKKMRALKTWSSYVITDCGRFEKLYGKTADRKRKLYNGRIKVDYYQFYGPKPNA